MGVVSDASSVVVPGSIRTTPMEGPGGASMGLAVWIPGSTIKSLVSSV